MLTKREGAVISAFTGIMMGKFGDMHEYAEELLDTPIYTHSFGDKEFAKQLKEVSKADFIAISDSIAQNSS